MNVTSGIESGFDIKDIRQHFPILQRQVKGKPLIYFDNAATSQKPQIVLDALSNYYGHYNANIHRGIHTLAEEATAAFEETRDAIRDFIHAGHREEIIFTKGTTESINLVAYTWGRANIQDGDEILISNMEHHSNIVPWQILCKEKNALLKIIPVNDEGELDMEAYKKLISHKTKLVSVVHVSNALGTINPVKDIIRLAHQAGAVVLIDGAQSAVHLDIDVAEMDCDFFAFSMHKLFGPTGVGILYGKKDILENMPPFMGGGEMIKEVHFDKTTYASLPYKFEAGTPNIADVNACKAALVFIDKIGKENLRQHENELLAYATRELKKIDGLHIIGNAKHKVSVISFIVDKIHPQDLGILLDNSGIAVRTGHHCTQPLMQRFGIPGTVRASFSVYNTTEEIDTFVLALKKAIKMLA
ncbi:MAG: cysteine desulfurase [Bacteroidetes bacterium]|nr:cysteine desulfurase [Bacteroidota bacterium]